MYQSCPPLCRARYVERTFGFETAVELAQPSIQAAHEEARGAKNGVGIGKYGVAKL